MIYGWMNSYIIIVIVYFIIIINIGFIFSSPGQKYRLLKNFVIILLFIIVYYIPTWILVDLTSYLPTKFGTLLFQLIWKPNTDLIIRNLIFVMCLNSIIFLFFAQNWSKSLFLKLFLPHNKSYILNKIIEM